MKRFLCLTLIALFLGSIVGCATPRQPQPDMESVHQNHKEAQKDLQKEEDRQEDDE